MASTSISKFSMLRSQANTSPISQCPKFSFYASCIRDVTIGINHPTALVITKSAMAPALPELPIVESSEFSFVVEEVSLQLEQCEGDWKFFYEGRLQKIRQQQGLFVASNLLRDLSSKRQQISHKLKVKTVNQGMGGCWTYSFASHSSQLLGWGDLTRRWL